ncbi:MAG: hypothetical protein AAFY88_01115 [Acidobacteriota bacterium]
MPSKTEIPTSARLRRITIAILLTSAALLTTAPALAQEATASEKRSTAVIADLFETVSRILEHLDVLPGMPDGATVGEADEEEDGGSLPSMGFEIEPNG